MIITRTPLRISFVGGGSDLPAFYADEPGCVVSATINKYVYLTVNPKYDGAVRVSYSRTENVSAAREVEHPLVRACLDLANIRRGVEIVSVADVPAGTGLGSSSAFTVGLLQALYAHQHEFHPTDALANDACQVEMVFCRAHTGKQDQYAAAFGGLRSYTFQSDGRVGPEALPLSAEALSVFQSRLLLLDTGIRRDASAVLAGQQTDMRDSRARANVRALANLAQTFRDALLAGRFAECGAILDTAWQLKRHMRGVSTEQIDRWYATAKQCGAMGGKICGAGGGGMLLFYANPDRHPAIARATGLRTVPITLTQQGATVIYAD